jgi:hypothetical protein
MDSIRVSEAPDPGSIPGEATTQNYLTSNPPEYFIPGGFLFYSRQFYYVINLKR